MNFAAIFRMLALCGAGYGVLMVLCAVLGLLLGEPLQFRVFLTTAVLAATVSAATLTLIGRPKRRAQPSDALAFMVFFWIFSGVVCAPPFLMGLPNDSMISAVHEAVSALTTTGHSGLDQAGNPMPVSVLFWRAILHLAGAVATITFAATVLAALSLDGPGIHRTPLFSMSDASFFDTMPRVLRFTAASLALVILLVVAIELVSGIDVQTAFLDAVSAATTGMADPAGHFADVTHAGRAVGLTVGLLAGTLGIYFLIQLSSRHWRRAFSDAEVLTFCFAMAVFSGLAALAGLHGFNSVGWALSSLSTSGVALVHPETTNQLPLALQLAPPLIGGAALSAAGGLKLGRLYVLSRRVGHEFARMGFRESLSFFQFRGRGQSDRTLMGIWVYLVAYIMASVAGLLLFSFVGLSFDEAIASTVGSLTNAGHLIADDAHIYEEKYQVLLIFGMILGRLEVLALIPLLTLSFWRR